MNIGVVCHGLPPYHNAGAEWTLLELCLACEHAGHTVVVSALPSPGIPQAEAPWSPDDSSITVWPTLPIGLGPHADVIITHLDMSGVARQLANQHGKPLARIIHSPAQAGLVQADLTIANAEHVQSRAQLYHANTVLMRPHCPRYRYDTHGSTTDNDITLVNTSPGKGGNLFYNLAQQDPAHHYRAIIGSYDAQLGNNYTPLPNLTIHPCTPHMRPHYAATRILLCPSDSESWGRVAVEAAWAGVPAILTPVPGFIESMEWGAGGWASLDRPGMWLDLIDQLDDDEAWQQASTTARARAEWITEQTAADLDATIRALEALA